jgi:thiosulfate reductase cytochrome b subunit
MVAKKVTIATSVPPAATVSPDAAAEAGSAVLLVAVPDDVPPGWGAPVPVASSDGLQEAARAAVDSGDPAVLIFTGDLPEARTPGLKDIMVAKKVTIATLGAATSDEGEPQQPAAEASEKPGATGATSATGAELPNEEPNVPKTSDHLPSGTEGGSSGALNGPDERVTQAERPDPETEADAPNAASAPSVPTPVAPIAKQRPSKAARATGWIVFCVVTVIIAVVAAKLLRGLGPVQDFIHTYPGAAPRPESTPVGLPAWLGWQHFLNAFFLVLIISTGVRIRRETKPPATWTSRRTGKKISLTVWLHQGIDLFWLLNGAVFIVVLFATGQWMRLVPTDWGVFPNAISAGLQYLSLDWPASNGWVVYNALQQLAYFVTVFIAAPLAALSGWRMSTVFPKSLERTLPMSAARRIHFPVMVYFLVFVVVHVGLVLATGMKRNLNHVFAATDAGGWAGFLTFVLALLVMVAGWALARPAFVAPVARAFGDVSSR